MHITGHLKLLRILGFILGVCLWGWGVCVCVCVFGGGGVFRGGDGGVCVFGEGVGARF